MSNKKLVSQSKEKISDLEFAIYKKLSDARSKIQTALTESNNTDKIVDINIELMILLDSLKFQKPHAHYMLNSLELSMMKLSLLDTNKTKIKKENHKKKVNAPKLNIRSTLDSSNLLQVPVEMAVDPLVNNQLGDNQPEINFLGKGNSRNFISETNHEGVSNFMESGVRTNVSHTVGKVSIGIINNKIDNRQIHSRIDSFGQNNNSDHIKNMNNVNRKTDRNSDDEYYEMQLTQKKTKISEYNIEIIL